MISILVNCMTLYPHYQLYVCDVPIGLIDLPLVVCLKTLDCLIQLDLERFKIHLYVDNIKKGKGNSKVYTRLIDLSPVFFSCS